MHKRSRWRIATVLGAFAAAFLPLDVLLGMLGLILLDRAEGRVPQDIEEVDREFRVAHPYYSHDLVPGFDGFAQWGPARYTMRTNSLGFRDSSARQVPVSAGVRRILFIGDSFTEGLGVDYESSFAERLAATLAPAGIELLNAAVVTYSPAIYWKKIEYLVTRQLVQFDAVVVFFDISDIQDEALSYRIDDEGHVAEMPEGPVDALGTWRRHSFTYRAVERAVQRLHPHPPWIGCSNAEANRPICRSAWTLSRVAMDRYGREGLIRADRHMTRLAELLRAEGIPLTIVVYPWPQQLLWNDRSSVQVSYWQRWAQRERAQAIDLFTPFLAEADRLGAIGAIDRYFLDGDMHWNARGHKLVADNLQRHFRAPSISPP